MLSLCTRGQAVTSPRESNLLVSGGWAARRLVYSTTDTWASQSAIVTTETPERERALPQLCDQLIQAFTLLRVRNNGWEESESQTDLTRQLPFAHIC